MNKTITAISAASLLIMQSVSRADDTLYQTGVEPVTYKNSHFALDPQYDNRDYDAESSLKTYGGKTPFATPRSLVELGYPVYAKGQLPAPGHWLGKNNPVTQQFLLYGDARLAASSSKNLSVVGAELTLEADWKLTGTERIHASFTPLENDGEFTRVVKAKGLEQESTSKLSGEPDALFFEGDLGAIFGGIAGSSMSWDLPFAFGLMPLQFQNGYFLDDAVTGLAVSTIAGNSSSLHISNYDITFFAASDDVDQTFTDTTPATLQDQTASIAGVTAYLDANQGHWEINIGASDSDVLSYSTAAVGFTRRYGSWLSNSIRIMHSTAQDVPTTVPAESVEGTLLVLENSLITGLPSTLVPYLNLFYADGTPQPLARAFNKGGYLTNVGITFESDALTAFTGLPSSPFNTLGAALGLEYLFDLSQQLVFEVGYQDRISTDKPSSLSDTQLAGGVRYQINIGYAWAFKADFLTVDNSIDTDNTVKLELTRKF